MENLKCVLKDEFLLVQNIFRKHGVSVELFEELTATWDQKYENAIRIEAEEKKDTNIPQLDGPVSESSDDDFEEVLDHQTVAKEIPDEDESLDEDDDEVDSVNDLENVNSLGTKIKEETQECDEFGAASSDCEAQSNHHFEPISFTDSDDYDSLIRDDPEGSTFTKNIVCCKYVKVSKNRDVWSIKLRDGIINVDGSEYTFASAKGQADWQIY